MENDPIEPKEGMQSIIIDLANGSRKPQNDEEIELLAEIKEAEAKGYMLDLEFD